MKKLTLPMMILGLFCVGLLYFSSVSPVHAKTKSKGTARILVLMVDFSDKPGQVPADYFRKLMFGTRPDIAPFGSFKDYFAEVSYGALSITGEVANTGMNWYRVPQESGYYAGGARGKGSYPNNAQRLVEDAIAMAEAAGVNFGPYDTDNDGYVDVLYVIHAGRGSESSGCTCDIQSQYQDFYTPLPRFRQFATKATNAAGNSIFVRDYVVVPEYVDVPGDQTIGAYVHEFGHVLGLPDLYDKRGARTGGLGKWSLMAAGALNSSADANGRQVEGNLPAHPDAWSKMKLGWVKPSAATGSVTIPAVEASGVVHKLCADTPGQEYFLLENRQRIGFDTALPGSGLAIYHVDERMPSNEEPGCDGCPLHYKVSIEQADAMFDLESGNNAGDTGDLFPGSMGNRAFGNRTRPSSDNYDGAPTGVSVRRITETAGVITADVRSTNSDRVVMSGVKGLNISWPRVAFDGDNYFVVWQDERANPNNPQLYGARVTPCGKTLESDGFPITAAGSRDYYPRIAYGRGDDLHANNILNGRYFTVWQRSNPGSQSWEVYGSSVPTTPSTGSSPILQIATLPGHDLWAPDVASNRNDGFLVTWTDSPKLPAEMPSAIRAVRIDRDDRLLDSTPIQVSEPSDTRVGHSAVAYGDNGYLVVWENEGRSVLGVALVSQSGIVTRRTTIPSYATFARPRVTWSAISKTFLVAWNEWDTSSGVGVYSVEAQLIDANGNLIGIPYYIAQGTRPNDNNFIDVGASDSGFFAAWSRSGRRDSDIYATAISPFTGTVVSPGGLPIEDRNADELLPGIGCGSFQCLVAHMHRLRNDTYGTVHGRLMPQ